MPSPTRLDHGAYLTARQDGDVTPVTPVTRSAQQLMGIALRGKAARPRGRQVSLVVTAAPRRRQVRIQAQTSIIAASAEPRVGPERTQ